MTSETDVVIVGAGSAGLSAAKELARRGLSHVVVEGSHRIGGRAYSEEIAPGVWFDLGCSYLHDGASNPFGPSKPPEGPEQRVQRGGSWYDDESFVRATNRYVVREAYRDYITPLAYGFGVGFRCVVPTGE